MSETDQVREDEGLKAGGTMADAGQADELATSAEPAHESEQAPGAEGAERAPESTSEPLPKPAPTPEPEPSHVVRQWVSMPGGSLDARVGAGAVEEIGVVLRSAVGRPRAAALAFDPAAPADLVEHLRRDLTSTGYEPHLVELPEAVSCHDLTALAQLLAQLGRAGITADDLVVAAGGYDALSLASAACTAWCGGVTLVGVPLDLHALVEAPLTPRPFDVGGKERMASLRPSFRHLVCDPVWMDLDQGEEPARLARALMAATAVAESQKAFEALFDRASSVAAGDGDDLMDQAMDTLKGRGRLVSSTVLAQRQALAYGQDVANALARLAPGVAPSTLLAGALRFAARLSAGQGKLKVDDVLAQDELLDRLDLPDVTGAFDPDEVIAALKAERFLRTNRFMVEAPESFGRVRLMSVDDELLREHVGAWCASRER